MRRSVKGFGSGGFTLVELLVVIAIIGTLVALLVAGRAVGPRNRPRQHLPQQPQAAHDRADVDGHQQKKLPGYINEVSDPAQSVEHERHVAPAAAARAGS